MDGDLRQVRPLEQRDRVEEETSSVVTSGITGVNSKDMVEREENSSRGLLVAESSSMEWTDEKHSLYLNFMETSFVRKFYNHEYCSMGLPSWKSKRKNLLDPNSSQQSNANIGVTCDQFKVLQSGCWRKHNFEKAQPPLDIADESHISVNPWVEHFKDVGKRQVTSPNVQANGASPCTEATCLGCQSISSGKFPASCSQIHKDSVVSRQEVSDQNFDNEENEGGQSSSLRRTKRAKTAASEVLDNDQVVPISKSPDKKRLYADRQSENMGDIAYWESGCQYSEQRGKNKTNGQ